jgi:ankyrin repeat protein
MDTTTTIEYLVKTGHINFQDILATSSFKGDVQTVVKILALSPKLLPKIDGISLFEASDSGHADVVALLLQDPRVDPTENNDHALQRACQRGHVDVVTLFLKGTRVNPGRHENIAFHLACENGHADVVTLLLKDPRVDPTVRGDYVCRPDARDVPAEIVKLIEEHIAKKDECMKFCEKEQAEEKAEEEANNQGKEPVAIVVIRKAMAKNSTKVIINLIQKHRESLTPILHEIVDWALEKEEMEILEQLTR